MILPDANTLLYAVNSSSDQHATALITTASIVNERKLTGVTAS